MRRVLFRFSATACFILFFLHCQNSLAGDTTLKVDSLLRALKYQSPDSNKVNTLNNLSYVYYMYNPDSGIYYGQRAAQLANDLGLKKHFATALSNVGINYWILNKFDQSIIYYDSAISINKKINNKQGLASTMSNLAIVYNTLGEVEKALSMHTYALELKREIKDTISQAKTLNSIGVIKKSNGDYAGALKDFFEALKIAESKNDHKLISSVCNNIGDYYKIKDKTYVALEYFNKALKSDIALGSKLAIGVDYGLIGSAYRDLGKYNSAIFYAKKSILISEELNNKRSMAANYGNLGNLYKSTNNFVQAIEYNMKALNIFKELGVLDQVAIGYLSLGHVYYSIATSDKSGKPGKPLNGSLMFQNEGTGQTLIIPEKTFDSDYSLALAEDNYRKGLEIALKINNTRTIMSLYDKLSDLYERRENFKDAFKYKKLYDNLSDSLNSVEVQSKIEALEKERISDVKQKEIELQKTQINAAKKERRFLIAGVVLLLLLIIIIYNRYRLKKKSNKKIHDAYIELKNTQEQLVHQEKLASLGALTAGVAHEIKNPLNFVNNFSDLSIDILDELKNAESNEEKEEIIQSVRQNLEKVKQHGRRADKIVEQMLQHTQRSSGDKQLTDINQLCDEVCQLLSYRVHKDDNDIKYIINKNFSKEIPEAMISAQDLSRAILNILQNAVYAVKEKKLSNNQSDYLPQVNIKTYQQNGSILIEIHDNGGGIPDNIREKIFEPFFTTKPTTQGTGLGLSISNDIVKAHQGKLTVTSIKNESTTFSISIPVGKN